MKALRRRLVQRASARTGSGFLHREDAFVTGEVFDQVDLFVATVLLGQRFAGARDHGAEFDDQLAAIVQTLDGIVEQPGDDFGSIGTGQQRAARFEFADGGWQFVVLGLADVRRVAADHVEGLVGFQPIVQIALQQRDSIGELEVLDVPLSDVESGQADVDGGDLRLWQRLGDCNRDRPAAGSDVQHRWVRPVRHATFDLVDGFDDQVLGFGPRHQHVFVDANRDRIELSIADQLGDGGTFAASPDEFTKGDALFFFGNLVERRVEFDALATTRMGEQNFRIQSRRLAALFPEEVRGPFQQTHDGPRSVVAGFSHRLVNHVAAELIAIIFDQRFGNRIEIARDDLIEFVNR